MNGLHQKLRWKAASIILLTLSFLLFVTGYFVNPSKHYFSLGGNFHLSILNQGLDSRIVLFNDESYGPYRGSVIGFAESQLPRQKYFGDTWGIYYRQFQWPDSTLWTLMVSIWYPIVGFGLVLLVCFRPRFFWQLRNAFKRSNSRDSSES